jgi:hypothetical protein
MRSQYSIGYTPINDVKDGSYRKLDIRLSNKELKAQARRSFGSAVSSACMALRIASSPTESRQEHF